MRNTTMTVWVFTAMVLLGSVAAADESQDRDAERQSRATYERFLDDIRETDAAYAEVLQKAVAEAREGNGEASLETQSDLIALRDKRDRIWNRCNIVALRYGWVMPEVNASSSEPTQRHTSGPDKVFEPARQIITAELAKEAKRIAGRLELPTITVLGTER